MSNVVVCVDCRSADRPRKATIDAASLTSHLCGHRTTNSITLLSTFRRFRGRKQSNIDVLIRWFNLVVYRCLQWPIMADMSTTGRDCTALTGGRDVSSPRTTWPTWRGQLEASLSSVIDAVCCYSETQYVLPIANKSTTASGDRTKGEENVSSDSLFIMHLHLHTGSRDHCAGSYTCMRR